MDTKQKQRIPALQIPYYFWAGYWVVWLFIFSSFQPFEKAVWATSVSISIQALTVYINIIYLTPQWLEKRKYLIFAVLSFLLLFALSRLHIVLNPPTGKFPALRGTPRFPNAFVFIRVYFLLATALITSTAYKFARDRSKIMQNKKEIESQQLESELQLLKSQINPHFLFNTLNNIYTLAYLKEDNAAPMIMKLSQLLRYMLYECRDNYVSLENEILFLQNIVEMQRLKSDGFDKNLHWSVQGSHHGLSIAPLLLLPFIENAFKFSDIDSNPAAKIEIRLSVASNGQFTFTCHNTLKKKTQLNTESGGIGIQNVKKRLELLYPTSYFLDIRESEKNYQVQLKLTLQ